MLFFHWFYKVFFAKMLFFHWFYKVFSPKCRFSFVLEGFLEASKKVGAELIGYELYSASFV